MRTAKLGFGASRAALAAMVAMSSSAWGTYAETHQTMFANNNLDKIVLVNSDNAIVGKFTDVASAVASELKTNATVRHEDFLTIQDMVTDVRRRTLNGISDLEAAGLTFPVGIEEQLVGTENINEFDEASQDMNPNVSSNNDTNYAEVYTPNPITHLGFSVPWRQQGFDYKRSAGLRESMRQVAERLEETLFNGNSSISVSFGGSSYPIYGYTTHPDRGTITITDWSNTVNNDAIVDEVISSVNQMFSSQGGVEMNSVVLYYPKNFKAAMDRDYVSGFPSKTVRERIMDIPEIKDVKFAEKLANSNVVFVEMNPRTIQLAKASDMIAVPHTKVSPMENQTVTTYAAMVQIIKSDSNGNTGILHGSV